MSEKRKRDSATYFRLREAFLKENPVCFICKNREAVECHHTKGRGKWYLAVETFMGLCKPCHRRVHREIAWAQEHRYLIPFHLH